VVENLDPRVLGELPIFPLPGAVLLPGTLLPLHIFEPRYRQMTRHCLEGHGHLAIALLDDSAATQEPDPPKSLEKIMKTVGVGRIVQHERLPDGRYILLLEGRCRARVLDEFPLSGTRLFRLARAEEVVDEEDLSESDLASLVLRIKTAYLNVSGMPDDDPLAQFLLREDDPGRIADVVAARLLEDPIARQEVLAEKALGARLKLALEAVATAILESLGH
jgi:Lon protease-like protein